MQTDLEELTAEEVALQYKQLWMVEEMFRTVKTLLETRPIFHKCDETIRGHVFCSFLALLLRKELQDRLEAQGDKLEWAELLRDLEALQYTEVESQGKRFLLRSDLAGTTPPCSAPSAWRSHRASSESSFLGDFRRRPPGPLAAAAPRGSRARGTQVEARFNVHEQRPRAGPPVSLHGHSRRPLTATK